MANNWNISKEVEDFVKRRDTRCVYCRIEFESIEISRKSSASWEHIVNDLDLVDSWNIALCCISCNSSKGTKTILEWFHSDYCVSKNINSLTVASVVKSIIKSP